MKKNILTILVIALLLVPFISQANEPIFVDDGSGNGSGSGENGCETGGFFNTITGELCVTVPGDTGNTGTGNNATSSGTSTKSNLFVDTIKADNIAQNTATLYGVGGDVTTLNPTFPITAYFRYSKSAISPIFCNDIYGLNMVATGDIFLDEVSTTKDTYIPALKKNVLLKSFSQQIFNLSPNTTYYYCAIISDRNNIAYGGESIVKQFHTNCYNTTVETKLPATNIKSTSASLKGSYCSPKNNLDGAITNTKVTTYFEYINTTCPKGWTGWPLCKDSKSSGVCPKGWTGVWPECTAVWTTVGEQKYDMGNYANLYGDIKSNLSGLTPDTEYKFGAVVETTNSKEETKTTKGTFFTFKTIPGSGGGGSSGCTGAGCPTTPTTCRNGATNYPTCNLICLPGASCTCINGATNPPTCTKESGTGCLPGSACYTDWGPGGPDTGTWTSGDGGGTGTWGTGTDSGTWTTTWGTGGTGTVTWTGTGNGTGTWIGSSGSGTWTNGRGTGGAGTGTWRNLALGQTATPPSDAIVRYHEGIETVFTRQILANSNFAKLYGYQDGTSLQTFAEDLSHLFAKTFGYINREGKEIRVSPPDIAAYQLQLIGNRLTVYEYFGNKIIDIRNMTTTFKNASNYEYYFKK